MPVFDVFNSDAFSVISLTEAINKAPYKPRRIGSLGLFREQPITNTTAMIEEKDGHLSLITSTPRGGPGSTMGADKRTARLFKVPHFQRETQILADEIQGVRSFGSESNTDAVETIVNQRLADLRGDHEATLEYLRVGAIKGLILDGDGVTTLYNLFTEFGVQQTTHSIDFSPSGYDDDIRNECVAIQRKIENVLGAEPVTSYRAFCGDDFFDALVAHPAVKESLKYQESRLLRTDLRSGFEYGGIVWENYRGKVGGVPFFEDDEAYVVPEGTSIFVTYFAPADFIEAVNTPGLPVYAKIARDPEFDRWAKVHTQSNPLPLCLRPRAVVKVTMA